MICLFSCMRMLTQGVSIFRMGSSHEPWNSPRRVSSIMFFAASAGEHGKTAAPPANARLSSRVTGRTQPSIHAGGKKNPPAHGRTGVSPLHTLHSSPPRHPPPACARVDSTTRATKSLWTRPPRGLDAFAPAPLSSTAGRPSAVAAPGGIPAMQASTRRAQGGRNICARSTSAAWRSPKSMARRCHARYTPRRVSYRVRVAWHIFARSAWPNFPGSI